MMLQSAKPSLYRDFLLLSVLIVFALILVSLWIVYQTHQSHSEEVLQQLESEALRIDRALIIEIEHASYLLESIGRQIDTESGNIDVQLLRLLGSFAKNKRLQGSEFYWVDANQNVTLTGHMGILDKPIDISDRDYVKRAITAPWVMHIGQPVEGRVSGRWVMPIGMGITNKEGQFLGAVSIGLDIKALSKVISGVIKDSEINFAITNTAFTLLTQVADSPEFFGRYFSLQRLSDLNFSAQQSGVYSRANWWNNDAIFAYYEHSSQYPYIIFVGFDPETSRAAIGGILLPRLTQVALMTLFLILTLWTVRKRIIQPVMRLTQHSREMLMGQPFRHVASNDPVEIGELAAVITRLGDYIRERRLIEQELASKNSDLMKVKEAAEMTNYLKAKFFEQVGEALQQPAKALLESSASIRDELFGALGSEKYIEIADGMYMQSQQLIETLGDIRAISKAESGLLALNETPVDISFVINKCVRILQEKAGFQQQQVVLDLADSVAKIRGDELRIKQLILNLLINAAVESDSGSALRINTHHTSEEMRIEISYKPSAMRGAKRGEMPPSALMVARQGGSAGFMKLGYALSELIIAMHQGSLSTKALPDNVVKYLISFPASRLM